MSEPDSVAKNIFAAASQLPSEQRAAYLEGACAGDARLRGQVETLLHAHDQAGRLLENGPAGPAAGKTIQLQIPASEQLGDRIGHYKIREVIGEGGYGVVYVAQQEEPVRRRVALKVIKPGMDTKQVIARFEAERQALAMMDHPNIAKVLDAGATDSGRPYFVMELVRGIKITEYCDQNNLSTQERLGLFIKVCQAIQHAHQKGIIHRDLKPSNILVTLQDGVPVPKVIDFGIAKATEGRLTDKTVFTELHQFIGTPAYTSPEQAEMSGLDIDTRSDIYSLGVLLYELLTGRTPFDAKELAQAGLDAMRRTIREVDPVRPSTRIGKLKEEEKTTVAKRRQTEPPKLIQLIRGDLDWIVMKTLEKDRTRRYETANGLAMDLQRHLSNEPVSAGAPTTAYRFGKFLRRNQAALGVGVLLAVLTAASAASMFLLFKEFRAGKYGGITVSSSPEGAEVWRGGQMVGTTPFSSTGLLPGEFTYSLVLSNYQSVTNTTTLASRTHMNDFTCLRRAESSGAISVPNLPTNLTELTAIAPRGATILTLQGKVEVSRNGAVGWTLAQTNMVLSAGDRLRTDARSRAGLRLSDNSVVRINELTSLEVSPSATNKLQQPSLNLKNGTIYFFQRDGTSNSIHFSTPAGAGAIRG